MFLVPPSQVPSTFPSASLSLSTISRVYPLTPLASSLAAISVFSSSQDLEPCARLQAGTSNTAATVSNIFMMDLLGQWESGACVEHSKSGCGGAVVFNHDFA